jgi:Rrf2 family cysteine metabolism transcriptional repressor
MKISKKGEYALKAMIYLSLNYKKGPVQIKELAKKEKIPKKFLEQILLELKKAGLLDSVRGIGGGYRLIKPPDKVSLARVIRIVDGPLAPLSCVSKMAYIRCPDEKRCGLYSVMLDVRNAIAKILEGISFADVCKRTRGSLKGKR